MKKFLSLVLFLMGTMTSWAGTASAGTEIYTADGYKATVLEDGTVAITWIYNEGDVTIPAEVADNADGSTGTYAVSKVGNGGSVCDDKISSIIFSEGIKSIGQSAFWGKVQLTSLTLPATLTEIGGYAFGNCTGLTVIHSAAVTAPTLGADVFKTNESDMAWDYIGQHCVVYVPVGSASEYKKKTPWTYWDSFWYVLEPASVTMGEDGYATYYNWHGYKLPEGVTAYAVSKTENDKIQLLQAYAAGEEVAKSVGLVLKGEANATYRFELLPFATAEAPASNLLKGVHNTVTIQAEDEDCYYYKLAKSDNGLGFYWGATDGGVFELTANKAYLPIAKENTNQAKFFGISGQETTDISKVNNDAYMPAMIYTINGMRINGDYSRLSKGVYIINGKKVLVK